MLEMDRELKLHCMFHNLISLLLFIFLAYTHELIDNSLWGTSKNTEMRTIEILMVGYGDAFLLSSCTLHRF